MATISVVATAQPGNSPPRVKVDITDSGTPTITQVTVTRTDNTGRSSVVRTSDGNPLTLTTSGSTRIGTVYDYEMPHGVPVRYSTSEQPANTSAPVTVTSDTAWLVHVGVPGRSLPVLVQSVAAMSRRVTRGVFYPMGRTNAVVVTDGRRRSNEGRISLLTQTDDERRLLSTLIDDAGVLLLNPPSTRALGIDTSYVSFGDIDEERPSRMLFQPDRIWSMPYVTVDAPVGGSQAQYAWSDVTAKFATWQDLIAANATWAAVQAPTS